MCAMCIDCASEFGTFRQCGISLFFYFILRVICDFPAHRELHWVQHSIVFSGYIQFNVKNVTGYLFLIQGRKGY